MPTSSVVIDAEIVVCDSGGKPDFKAVIEGPDLSAWCFDLLELNRRDLRELPPVRCSEEFSDPFVSKLNYQLYRSGKNPGWMKVKCHAWR